MQPVSAADIGLAGLLGMRLRLTATPLKAEPASYRDAVNEDRFVSMEQCRVAELLADHVVVGLGIRLIGAQGWVGPADEGRKVATFLPGTRPDRIAGPSLDREITRLQVHEECGAGHQSPEQAGFALAAAAKDSQFEHALFGQPFIRGDDAQGHQRPPCVVQIPAPCGLSRSAVSVMMARR